mmetsp:Transcript_7491/g.13059  ORF Transcript_7491/g.13059 Transcript_7491/m.13059 type:complete len:101 (+) Transcript_7491:90-392(+)
MTNQNLEIVPEVAATKRTVIAIATARTVASRLGATGIRKIVPSLWSTWTAGCSQLSRRHPNQGAAVTLIMTATLTLRPCGFLKHVAIRFLEELVTGLRRK